MLIREENLVTLNAKNKVQLITIKLSYNPITRTYQINRTSGQFGGKIIYQPAVNITTSNTKNTIGEQASHQYNAIVQNYLDKRYVKLSSLTKTRIELLTEPTIKNLLNGNVISKEYTLPRPMLAKSSDYCSADIWNKPWAVSPKMNGVRMLMYYQNGIVKTISRGNKDYNVATQHLREDPAIIALFTTNPNLVLDGELYIHDFNWPEERIFNLARVSERTPDCDKLEYWIYDYIDIKPFKERMQILNAIRELFPSDSKIKIINHEIVSGYSIIKKFHDHFVSNGFEGLYARNIDREYGINKRSSLYYVQFKDYKTGEFRINKIELDGSNLKFTLANSDEYEFCVNPLNVTDSNEILSNKEKYIGKKITCKYNVTNKDKVPLQPILARIPFIES